MPRAFRTAGALALALALLVLLLPTTAVAAPRWLAPVDLTPPGGAVFGPRVVVDGAGNRLALWTEQRGTGRVVRGSSRTAGSTTWGAPFDVSPAPVTTFAVAADPAGNVIALWGATAPGPAPGSSTIQVAIRPAGSAAFGAPVDLSGPGAFPTMALAVNPQGGLVVAWSQAGPNNGSPATVMTRSRPAGGTEWSAPEALSAPGEHAPFSDVAAGPDGRAAVVWTSATGGGPFTARARVRDAAGGPWGPERVVSAADLRAHAPGVAMGPDGETLVTWPSGDSPDTTILVASRPAGGEWTAPGELGPGVAAPLVGARPVIEPDGTATVVWLTGFGGRVVARTRPAGGSFGPEQALSSADVRVDPFPLGIAGGGPAGGVIAVWSRNGLPAPQVVQAAIKPAGSLTFGTAADVSARGRNGTSPSAALAPGGEAVAAWVDAASVPSLAGAIQVADYTERPGPVLTDPPVVPRGIEAPERAVAGALVRVRIDFAGSVDRVPVRVQRRGSRGFRDVGPVVTVTGASAELPVRLGPGRAVLRVAYEDRGTPAVTGTATVVVTKPRTPLVPIAASRVVVGAGAVWLLTSEDGEAQVVRLNPKTGRVQGKPIPVPGARGMAVGGGAVWAVRGEGSEQGLLRIDPATRAVTEIAFSSGGGIAAGPAGVWAIECERIPGVRPACARRNVVRIDPATNGIAKRVPVGDTHTDSGSVFIRAVGAHAVWLGFTDYDTTSTARLDPPRGAIGTSFGIDGVTAASGGLLWGVTSRRCELSRAGLGGKVARLGRVPGSAGWRCTGIVARPGTLWIVQVPADSGSDVIGPPAPARLVRLHARTRRPVGRPFPLGMPTVTLDVGAGAVWAASSEEGVVRRIDPRAAARGGAGARPPVRLAAGAWGRPASISGPVGRSAVHLRLVAGPSGRAAALWRRSAQRHFGNGGPYEVVSAVRPSGRDRWAAPQRLAAIRVGLPYADTPGLAMSAAGEGLATWWQREPGGVARIVASRLAPSGTRWGGSSPIPGPEQVLGSPQPAVAADGSARVAWRCRCATGTLPSGAVVARRPAGGAFEAGALLPGAVGLDALDLAINRRGDGVLVWTGLIEGGTQAASAPAGGGFGDSARISAPRASIFSGSGRSPAVVMTDAGDALAAWATGDGIEAARRAPDGTWSTPVRIARVAGAPGIGLDARGNAVAIFMAKEGATGHRRLYVVAARPGGAWSRPRAISPRGSVDHLSEGPALAMTPGGGAVLAWTQRVAGRQRVLARAWSARRGWSAVEAVSTAQRKAREVRIAIDARGVATAAWIAESGTAPRIREVVRVATRRVR